ncbi:hypothetical protein CJ030_MR1G004841 [Morella rubra]|uniref:RNase H type-1 domain-containing protein n=1 Tax=Morella rubra TaxID=262757 RepID=A0A6A1WRI8_9ROSI|nr:hypothetical protein CJ030_MR1G004841 [Morella rubra]
MDPLVGEAFALAEAVALAKRKNWTWVIFESDLLVPCREVNSDALTQLWAIMGMKYLRDCLSMFVEWRIAWVPRICNAMAHKLAQLAAVGIYGCSSFFVILKHIWSCDMSSGF